MRMRNTSIGIVLNTDSQITRYRIEVKILALPTTNILYNKNGIYYVIISFVYY